MGPTCAKPILVSAATTTLAVFSSATHMYCFPGIVVAFSSTLISLSDSTRTCAPRATARGTGRELANLRKSSSVYSPPSEVLVKKLPAARCLTMKEASLDCFCRAA